MNFSFFSLLAMFSASLAIGCIVFLLIKSLSGLSIRKKDFLCQRSESVHQNEHSISAHCEINQHPLTRLVWPLIDRLSTCIWPLMTWNFRHKLTKLLDQSGWVNWNCSQFLALQFLLALLGLWSVLFILFMTSVRDLVFLLLTVIITTVTAGISPRFLLRAKKKQRYTEIENGLPFFLDMLALGLDAGMNIQSAIQLALDHLSDGALKQEWQKTIFEIRSGVSRADAFRHLSQRVDLLCIRQMVIAFIQAESMGLSLTGSVNQFSRHQVQSRFLRAEKLGLQAPIKMLFPLGFCIFPCTFLILGFPVLAQLIGIKL